MKGATVVPAVRRHPEIWVFLDPPEPHCQVVDCTRSPVGTIVWLGKNYISLNCNDICAWHMFRAKAAGGDLFYPLGVRPPLEAILQAVNAEIMRRQRPQQTHTYQFNFGGGTGSSTFYWNR